MQACTIRLELHCKIMQYEQNIIFEDGGYVGYLLKNDEVVYFTPKCQTINAASSNLTNHINSSKKVAKSSTEPSSMFVSSQSIRVNRSNINPNPQTAGTPNPNYQTPPKRCCGRG